MRETNCGACLGSGRNTHGEQCLGGCRGTGFVHNRDVRPKLDDALMFGINATMEPATKTTKPVAAVAASVNNLRDFALVDVRDAMGTWHCVAGINDLLVEQQTSAANRVASAYGFNNQADRGPTTTTMTLTFYPDDVDAGQALLLDFGFDKTTFAIRVVGDDYVDTFEAFVVSTDTIKCRFEMGRVEMSMTNHTRSSAIIRFAPTVEPLPSKPDELPATEALMMSASACRVCGKATVVKGVDGRPEHPTCGAWGTTA